MTTVAEPIHKDKIDELLRKERDRGTTGWFALTHPKGCGCGYDGDYFVAGKRPYHGHVIVWPTDRDPNLLEVLNDYAEDGLTAHVIEYEQSMGKCVSWYTLHENH